MQSINHIPALIPVTWTWQREYIQSTKPSRNQLQAAFPLALLCSRGQRAGHSILEIVILDRQFSVPQGHATQVAQAQLLGLRDLGLHGRRADVSAVPDGAGGGRRTDPDLRGRNGLAPRLERAEEAVLAVAAVGLLVVVELHPDHVRLLQDVVRQRRVGPRALRRGGDVVLLGRVRVHVGAQLVHQSEVAGWVVVLVV